MEIAALNVPVKGGNVARCELFIDSSYMEVELCIMLVVRLLADDAEAGAL